MYNVYKYSLTWMAHYLHDRWIKKQVLPSGRGTQNHVYLLIWVSLYCPTHWSDLKLYINGPTVIRWGGTCTLQNSPYSPVCDLLNGKIKDLEHTSVCHLSIICLSTVMYATTFCLSLKWCKKYPGPIEENKKFFANDKLSFGSLHQTTDCRNVRIKCKIWS